MFEPNSWLVLGGALTLLVALVHSVLGEILIFQRMRSGALVPTKGQPVLRERHVRILWATWHIVSLLGFGMAAVLLGMALLPQWELRDLLLRAVSLSMGASSALVLFATKGMQPGWLGLLLVAISAWMAV